MRPSLRNFIADLPKVELHCHIADAIPADMLFDLADRNGVSLAPFTPKTIYKTSSFEDYLDRLALMCSVLRQPLDFKTVLSEALRRMAACNVRYCELFFNPDDHTLEYESMLDAYTAAIEEAEETFGIRARLIPSINRSLGPERGMAMVRQVISNPSRYVVGVGLDNNEKLGPPVEYVDALNLARSFGLHVSAHAGETGDVSELNEAIDLLRIERIDHGYAVMQDMRLTSRLAESGTPFTACWTSCELISGNPLVVAEMIRAGLNVSINTDAPGTFDTDINREYERVAEAMELDAQGVSTIARAGVLASYLPQCDKTALLRDIEAHSNGYND